MFSQRQRSGARGGGGRRYCCFERGAIPARSPRERHGCLAGRGDRQAWPLALGRDGRAWKESIEQVRLGRAFSLFHAAGLAGVCQGQGSSGSTLLILAVPRWRCWREAGWRPRERSQMARCIIQWQWPADQRPGVESPRQRLVAWLAGRISRNICLPRAWLPR